MTPAALARVATETRNRLAHAGVTDMYGSQVEDVISALRVLAADPSTRGDVAVALGLEER